MITWTCDWPLKCGAQSWKTKPWTCGLWHYLWCIMSRIELNCRTLNWCWRIAWIYGTPVYLHPPTPHTHTLKLVVQPFQTPFLLTLPPTRWGLGAPSSAAVTSSSQTLTPLFTHQPPLLGCELHEDRSLVCSVLCDIPGPAQHLTHTYCLTSSCWVKEWMLGWLVESDGMKRTETRQGWQERNQWHCFCVRTSIRP